ncbi:MAG: LysM peptidoglycan-binding domain-containing protein [Candidimonas sp.]|nr:MAG: LysM peptidoglycan-binding domain-containing protein [Candidimonas sp.]
MKCLRLLILLIVAALAGCASTPSKHYVQQDTSYIATDTSRTIDLTTPPKDMWDRIRRGFAIPNLHGPLVDKWTNYYTSHPDQIQTMAERARKYLYYIVDQINQRGMPTELALLPFVESSYDPKALSRANASGLWQFIPSTGLHYNLQQTWWRDQRRDPVASTQAALDYLNYLYNLQGDWYLALASYNMGEGAVAAAMQANTNAGLPATYLAIKLPDETRNYVPKLQAIKNIIAHPARYGITLPYISNTPYFKMVRKSRNMDVAVAARLADMSVEDFKSLNASFNRPVIRGDHDPVLLLPANKVDIFNANLEAYKGRLSSWELYQPRKGQSYASIARQYGISLSKLRAVNSLTTSRSPAAAHAILVPVEGSGSVQLASYEVPSADVPRTRTVSYGGRVERHRINVRTHTVQHGDTLYSLAKRYDTTVEKLRKLNNMRDNTLSTGEHLRVPGTQVHG